MNIVALDKTLVHPRSDELATSSILRLHTRQTFQESGQNVVTEKICLNEICIMRTNNKRIALVIYVNGEYVTETLGDGLLISTPTGSTAYSLSAGGPILQNGVNGLLIVPIAPNSLSFRPLCLSDDSVITIKVYPSDFSSLNPRGAMHISATTVKVPHASALTTLSPSRDPRITWNVTKLTYSPLIQKQDWQHALVDGEASVFSGLELEIQKSPLPFTDWYSTVWPSERAGEISAP